MIYEDDDKGLVYARERRNRHVMMEGDLRLPRCDFCTSGTPVVFTIFSDKRSVEILDTEQKRSSGMNSDEEWAACAECCELVRAGDHEALAKRAHNQDPVQGECEETKALASRGAQVLTNGTQIAITSSMCFHSVLHEGLFWPGYQGRIEAVKPGERMVQRYVKVDFHDGGIIHKLRVYFA